MLLGTRLLHTQYTVHIVLCDQELMSRSKGDEGASDCYMIVLSMYLVRFLSDRLFHTEKVATYIYVFDSECLCGRRYTCTCNGHLPHKDIHSKDLTCYMQSDAPLKTLRAVISFWYNYIASCMPITLSDSEWMTGLYYSNVHV